MIETATQLCANSGNNTRSLPENFRKRESATSSVAFVQRDCTDQRRPESSKSLIIDQQYAGRLSQILNLPYGQAKEKLMDLPGVGPKTADILLAFVAKHPVIPVDTHIERVSKRLGIAPRNADYEKIRGNLESLIPSRDRLQLHLSLIAFGRAICKAPKARCAICPVSDLCPSSNV